METKEEDVPQSVFNEFYSNLDTKSLIEAAETYGQELNNILRDKVMKEDNINVLAEEILEYEIKPFHKQILKDQSATPTRKHMTLAFRGGGKSTVGTINRCIYEIVKNPNIRILIASKTQLQAEVFLREIKDHLEGNEKFIEIFGNYVGSKWDTKEIVVKKRTKKLKESTITCIGVGGPTASRHYDLIIADDIVDEENSRTELQRDRLRTWFYKSLMPTLEPDGRFFIIGTRWHPDDLHGLLLKNDPDFQTTIIKAISDEGESPWPEKFSIDFLIKKKHEIGVPIFETQYQMNTDAMEGKIFKYEDFHFYDQLPAEMIIYHGVDLAISLRTGADYFAHCTLGVAPDQKAYVVKIFRKRLSFAQQTATIIKEFFKTEAYRVGIESNAYQAAQTGEVQEAVGKKKVIPVYTLKDKVTRAMKLSAKVENGDILFGRDQMIVIEEMLRMPDGEHDDMFDALEIAYSLAKQGVRKKREREPGLL